jgi:hypothetical protein
MVRFTVIDAPNTLEKKPETALLNEEALADALIADVTILSPVEESGFKKLRI